MGEAERVFVGLGANLGDRAANLRAALERIAALPETRLVRVSAIRETEPWGVTDQPPFLNAAAELCTALEPEALLSALKEIERALGRTPSCRWGPRLIDIDLLLYGDRAVRTESLTLPHPGILERPFVREPLAEIAPELMEKLGAALPLRSPRPDR